MINFKFVMVITRSSKLQTRCSALKRRSRLESELPKKKSRFRGRLLKEMTSQVRNIKCPRFLKPKNVRVTEEKKKHTNDVNDKPVTVESQESKNSAISLENTYEKLLKQRCQGNPLIRKAVREIDIMETKNVSHVLDSAVKANGVRPSLIQAFNAMTRNEKISQMEFDSQISKMSLTRKTIVDNFTENYCRLKHEVWEDLRLRPRERKINYCSVNKYKKFRLKCMNTKSPWRPKLHRKKENRAVDLDCARPVVVETKQPEPIPTLEPTQKNDVEIDKEVNSASPEVPENIQEEDFEFDDAETDNCELTDFEVQLPSEEEQSKEVQLLSEEEQSKIVQPAKRPRRESKCRTMNWNNGRDIDKRDELEKEKRIPKKIFEKKKSQMRMFIERFTSSESDCSDVEIDYPPPSDATALENMRKKANWDTKLPPEYLAGFEEEINGEEEGKAVNQPIVDDHVIREALVKVESSSLEDILRQCIKLVIDDETKCKIQSDPIVAELTEVDNEQFYHLVTTLQGTDFIVKTAAMQNVRGPDDKILQLYNCTICQKEEESPEKEKEVKMNSIKPKSQPHPSDSNAMKMRRPKTKKSHPYLVPGGMAHKSKHHRLDNSKLRTILPKSQLSISPVSMTENFKDERRVVVRAVCVKKQENMTEESEDNLQLDPDLKDKIISDIGQTSKVLPDSRGLREAQKRMGRRKTGPDIHPVTRRMNRKSHRKMLMGSVGPEPFPMFLKRPVKIPEPMVMTPVVVSPKPTISQYSESVETPVYATTKPRGSHVVNRNELRNFGSPQKVELDNKGRFVDPYKPLERHQESPATALTASELLKLQKIDGSKPPADENTLPSDAMKNRESGGEDSDFELAESSGGAQVFQFTMAQPHEVTVLPFLPQGAELTGKPLFNEKPGSFRKILPRPAADILSSKAFFQRASSKAVVTVSNIDSQQIGNIQRRPVAEPVSPVHEQDREMTFLKSLLRKNASILNRRRGLSRGDTEAPKTEPNNTGFQMYSPATINPLVKCKTTGNLRVPPASFYTSVSTSNQSSVSVASMKPITVSVTRRTNECSDPMDGSR